MTYACGCVLLVVLYFAYGSYCFWLTTVMRRGCVLANMINPEDRCSYRLICNCAFVYSVQGHASMMHACKSITVTRCVSRIQTVIAMQVGGLHIRVDRAGQSAHGSTGGSVMYERNRTVFVGNLPFDVEVGFPPSCCRHLR